MTSASVRSQMSRIGLSTEPDDAATILAIRDLTTFGEHDLAARLTALEDELTESVRKERAAAAKVSRLESELADFDMDDLRRRAARAGSSELPDSTYTIAEGSGVDHTNLVAAAEELEIAKGFYERLRKDVTT